MADYVQILDTQIEPDAPLTSTLAAQWRDNPIAIAEGAIGAPKVDRKALLGSRMGAVSTSGTAWSGAITGIGDVSEFVMHCFMSGNPGPGITEIRFSTDNGVTWGAGQTLRASISPGLIAHVNTTNGQVDAIAQDAAANSTTTLSIPAGVVNALSIRASVAVDRLSAIFIATGGR
jgi:hypothetical protein